MSKRNAFQEWIQAGEISGRGDYTLLAGRRPTRRVLASVGVVGCYCGRYVPENHRIHGRFVVPPPEWVADLIRDVSDHVLTTEMGRKLRRKLKAKP